MVRIEPSHGGAPCTGAVFALWVGGLVCPPGFHLSLVRCLRYLPTYYTVYWSSFFCLYLVVGPLLIHLSPEFFPCLSRFWSALGGQGWGVFLYVCCPSYLSICWSVETHFLCQVFLPEMLTTFPYQVIWRRHSPVQRSPALLTAAFRHGWRGCNAAGKQFLLGWKRIAFSRLTYRIYKVFNVNIIFITDSQSLCLWCISSSPCPFTRVPGMGRLGGLHFFLWFWHLGKIGSTFCIFLIFAFTRAWGEFSCQVGRLQVKWPW